MDSYKELLELILPPMLLEYFDLIKTEIKEEKMHLYFEENNTPPTEFNDRILISKGFHKESVIQDFPLRGKYVFLHVKRRRWTDKTTSEIIQRDWSLVSKGTRMTKEFAAFLKEVSRY